MTLPQRNFWTNNAALSQPGGVALAKSAMDAQLAALHATLGLVAGPIVPLSNDTLSAPTTGIVVVDTQAGEPFDVLNVIQIPSEEEPQIILLRIANPARIVRVNNSSVASGNILLREGSHFTFTNAASYLLLHRLSAGTWREIYRSYGTDTFGRSGDSEWLWIGPNRLRQTGRVVTSATALVTVNFPKPFAGEVNDIRLGGTYWVTTATDTDFFVRLSGLSLTGMSVSTTSENGPQVSRVVHWSAEGYGELP